MTPELNSTRYDAQPQLTLMMAKGCAKNVIEP